MLNGTRVTMIGGDARQLVVIRKLAQLGASIQIIGFDNWECHIDGVRKVNLSPESVVSSDAILLPAVGTNDEGFIESSYSTNTFHFSDDIIKAIPAHAQIITGMAKPYLKKKCLAYGIRLVELFERDDVAILNSIPTAEGALLMAIQNTDYTIHGSNCLVLGIGRTGLTMAHTLKGLGAHVSVGVRRPKHYARACVMGFDPFYMTELGERAAHADIIFNTVPVMVLPASILSKLPIHSLIIDLASKPGGTDFNYAEAHGIKAFLAPGLPGIVAPKTAGGIIGETICLLLTEKSDEGGDGE
ncbi:MAG: dipicolinate synthase subunit DpsA [Gorillibacterium sp.]|nr:dipicolinate synthase subunit DpsA [Gorillibacterium sp.]